VTGPRVAWAFLRRDAAIAASQRFHFVLQALGLVAGVATFAYLSRFVGNPSGRGGEAEALSPVSAGGTLGFWLVGLAVGELFRRTTMALARKVREAQLEGTLEAMLSTPAPAAWIVLSAPLFEIGAGALQAVFMVAAGVVVFGVPLGPVNAVALVLTTITSLLAFGALGLLGGAITMLLRRTDPLTALLGLGGVLVGGVLFPIAELPASLRAIASVFPLAPSLEAFRLSLFAGAGLDRIGAPLLEVAVFAAACAPLAGVAFAFALRRARVGGSLGQY